YQFALMGSELARAVDGLKAPKVALLNIGEEDMKGNTLTKQVSTLMQNDDDLNYIGFAEGNDVYHGDVDVVVCDGFVGNVALKTSEGVARMITGGLKQEFTRGPLSRLAGLVALPVLRRLRRRFDPRRYNGASLLGLRGIVIKSHGGADAFSFSNAINIAVQAVNEDVPAKIAHHLEHRTQLAAEAN
ncbi:MAG: phosphate acyltransferase, partial [Gammaproteobacteria bacterium]